MSHHSLNLNLNLNLPASQKSLYRLIWFQIQVLCVTFYPTFSRLWWERSWIFYVCCWAGMMDSGLSLRVFLLSLPCFMLQHGAWKTGLPWVAEGPGVDLHWQNWWTAINNITGYWKHHLFCWSLLRSLLFPFPQPQATLSLIFIGRTQFVGDYYPIALDTFHAVWDYYPFALPLKGRKGDPFLLHQAGKSQPGGTSITNSLSAHVVSNTALQDW